MPENNLNNLYSRNLGKKRKFWIGQNSYYRPDTPGRLRTAAKRSGLQMVSKVRFIGRNG